MHWFWILIDFDVLFVLVIAQITVLFFTNYQSVISLLGMLRRRTPNRGGIVGPRYALLVCAHNEELVVGNIVRNLKEHMDYPSDLYDVYVIVDNCTDRTEEAVIEAGGIALSRNDPTQVGKGYGIQWALRRIQEIELSGTEYDGIGIFDADNLVTSNTLKQVSLRLSEGATVIQLYLDSKNPDQNWITRAYGFSYLATNRIFQLARENLKLGAQLGGTGMFFSSSVLKSYGWNATSLTEDLEFTTLYALRERNRAVWIHEAKVYDEKPTSMRLSYRQRTRWMKGHFDCAMRYTGPVLKSLLKNPHILLFDILVYLWQPSRILLAGAGLSFFLLSLVWHYPSVVQKWILNDWVWGISLGIHFSLPVIALLLEKQYKQILWYIPSYVFSFTWIPIIPVAFFRRHEKTWTHTIHSDAVSIQDITGVET